MIKIYKVLKQEAVEKLVFFNSVNKIYIKALKGLGFSDVVGVKKSITKNVKLNTTSLKFFLSDKSSFFSFLRNLDNILKGISNGFFFEMSIRGIGYKCYYFDENKLFLNLGYSHYIIYSLPKDVLVFLKKGKIYVYSLSKELLGSVVKDIQNLRIADAYKAKGIVDSNKVFNLKEGKKR